MNTQQVNILALNIGDIVRFHGARFVITSTKLLPQGADHIAQYGVISDTMCANGKWLDGAEVTGYFGRDKDWGFQGNSHATHTVEVRGA